MEYKIEYSISVEEFLEMVEAVGWKTYSTEQVKKALKNTMYMVKISYNNEIVGMGRVVGDYSIVCMLTDICVKPKAQRKGIGFKIVNELFFKFIILILVSFIFNPIVDKPILIFSKRFIKKSLDLCIIQISSLYLPYHLA